MWELPEPITKALLWFLEQSGVFKSMLALLAATSLLLFLPIGQIVEFRHRHLIPVITMWVISLVIVLAQAGEKWVAPAWNRRRGRGKTKEHLKRLSLPEKKMLRPCVERRSRTEYVNNNLMEVQTAELLVSKGILVKSGPPNAFQ